MKLSKQELVQRLILAEQYISENENKWVTAHFESFKYWSGATRDWSLVEEVWLNPEKPRFIQAKQKVQK